ncbi:JNK-interacting protein 1 isoform X1, partial [Biomphalaria glabrata]
MSAKLNTARPTQPRVLELTSSSNHHSVISKIPAKISTNMMKLHRPLCSDVTLRLVDISPGFDDDDDDTDYTDIDGKDDTANDLDNGNGPALDTITRKNQNFYKTSNSNTTQDNTASSLDFNLNRHQHSRSQHRQHNHSSCSWYSRQNTPDKTAKDIYNQEHVLNGETYGENFHKVPLDSEFKRFVEEEGNDYKEEFDDTWEEETQMNLSQTSAPIERRLNQYSDAELSSSLEDVPGLEVCKRRASKCCEDECEEQSLYDSNDGSIPPKRRCLHEGGDEGYEKGSEESGEFEDVDESLDNFEDVVMPEAPEELPIDCDEDVDVFDKQIEPSLITSYYGDIGESELAKSIIQSVHADVISDEMTKSIAEEIHDVLVGDGHTKTDVDPQEKQLPFPYPFILKHAGHLFDTSRFLFATARSRSSSCTSRSTVDDVSYDTSRTSSGTNTSIRQHKVITSTPIKCSSNDQKKSNVNKVTSTKELEVTHRGLHRFIPRHKDEINIGIGDPLHVIKECDDLWCEGVNLRTGEKGIFPAMYANDLNFLEESDDDEDYWKFSMRFLGSVEVTSHKGDETLIQAINQVAATQKDKVNTASLSTLEINQYGIRMIDKSKEGHQKDAFSHFFALKNISFCGTHPKNNRYFAFITKHPREYKFACHVFYGDRPTHRARDAVG